MAETASPPRPEAGRRSPDDSEQLRIVLTGLDKSVKAYAREAAHEEGSKNPEGPWAKRIAMSVYNNLTHEYQTVKRTRQKEREIYENDSLTHHHGESDQAWRESAVSRYASEFGEQLARTEEGETFHNLSSEEYESNENASRVRGDLQSIIEDYAAGRITGEANLNASLERVAEGWRQDGVAKEFVGEAKMRAHNMFSQAEKVKAMVDGIAGLDAAGRAAEAKRILENAQFITGEAKVGERTEIKATAAERIAEKLSNSKFVSEKRIAGVTSLVGNETFVAGTLAVMTSAATYGASRLAATVVPGLGGGLIAGLRERRALRDERALAARRRAMGAEPTEMPTDAPATDVRGRAKKLFTKITGIGESEEVRRAEVEATLRTTRPVGEILGDIGSFYGSDGKLTIASEEDLKRAQNVCAEARARDDRNLIGFEGMDSKEMAENTADVSISIAKLQSDLKKLYEDPTAASVFGVQAEDFKQNLEEALSDANGVLDGEIRSQDRLQRKLERSRGLKRALRGTVISAGVGAVLGAIFGGGSRSASGPSHMGGATADQPTHIGGNADTPSHIGGADTSTEAPSHIGDGSTEAPAHIGGSDVDTTTEVPTHIGSPTEEAPSHIGGSEETPSHIGSSAEATPTPSPSGNGTPEAPTHIGGAESDAEAPSHIGGENSTVELSGTSTINAPDGYEVSTSDGYATIVTPDGKAFTNLPLAEDGSLTSQAQETLRAGGLSIKEDVDIIQGEAGLSHPNVTVDEFIQNHRGEMTDIGHREWVDDPNQYRLQNSVNADGSITISVASMTDDAWKQAAAEGHANVYLSASTGSSAQGFKIPIDASGRAHIEADSPAQALFGKNGNFLGGYEEAGITGGQTNGADNVAVLATAVGGHQETFTDNLVSQEPEAHHTYTITDEKINPDANAYVVAPDGSSAGFAAPIINLTGRKQMGQAERRTPTPAAASSGSTAGSSTGGGPRPSSSGPSPSGRTSTSSGAGGGSSESSSTDTSGGPETSSGPEAGSGPESTETDEQKEFRFFLDLDADPLVTLEGYGFPGIESMDERARKEANRFIGAGESKVDNPDDRERVLMEAIRLATEAEANGQTDGIRAHYAEALRVLQETLDHIRREAANAAAGAGTAGESEPEPEPEPSAGPEAEPATETPEEKEAKYFSDLDRSIYGLLEGYAYPGIETRSGRAIKEAARFVAYAQANIGYTADKADLLAEAIRLNTEARDGAETEELGFHFAETLGILNTMMGHARAEASAGPKEPEEEPSASTSEASEADDTEATNKSFFDSVDAMPLDMQPPFESFDKASAGERELKLAMAFVSMANGLGPTFGTSRKDIAENAKGFAEEDMENAPTDEAKALYRRVLDLLDKLGASTGPSAPSGSKGGASSEGTAEANADTEARVAKEKAFFDALNAELLDTPYGFDFPGYGGIGLPERKQAMRLINESIADLGGDSDKLAVVDMAMQKLNAAAAAADLSDAMKDLYAKARDVLSSSRNRVEKDVADNARGASLLDNLEGESRPFPFVDEFRGAGMKPSDYSVDARRLFARVYYEVGGDALPPAPEPPETPYPNDPPSIQRAYAVRMTEYNKQKEAYVKSMRTFMRKAQTTLQEVERSLGTNPNERQKSMLKDAADLVNRIYEIAQR